VGEHFPRLGWHDWTGKSIYIKTTIDPSVTHTQACTEAIHRWNELVGARFLMVPDKHSVANSGDVAINFYERGDAEAPFNTPLPGGGKAAGYALRYDAAGTMLGMGPGLTRRCDIYVNKDIDSFSTPYAAWVHYFAHEIGHAFGLADHPLEDINSVMSYRRQGMLLMGPSWEDQQGIADIYELPDLDVTPAMLEGVENLRGVWQMDRYGTWRKRGLSLWQIFIPGLPGISNRLPLQAHELYTVRMIQAGQLGYGRFSIFVQAGDQLWTYL